jgi:hypothetical protein
MKHRAASRAVLGGCDPRHRAASRGVFIIPRKRTKQKNMKVHIFPSRSSDFPFVYFVESCSRP